jgi:tRNA 2-selenouridine synthase
MMITQFTAPLPTTEDFKQIVLDNTPLIDVRAPIEYEKGAFPFSANLPLMTNDERHEVGIRYKEEGNEAAVALGHELVNEQVRAPRIESWKSFVDAYPNAMLYCFRGGMRSKIAQQWLHDAGVEITRLKGGYKAFRQYLINELESANETLSDQVQPIILSGPTGSGKTRVLHHIEQKVDLEGLAHHRGSAFGRHATPQPTQIDFENALAYDLIQQFAKPEVRHLVFEDEGRNVGSVHLPKGLFEAIKSGPKVLLETPLEKRIEYTLQEYVEWGQSEYITLFGEVEAGLIEWQHAMEDSFARIQKRLGGELYQRVLKAFNAAVEAQEEFKNFDAHRAWIETLLTEYYDPMYAYQLEQNQAEILFKGEPLAVVEYLKALEETK